MFIRWRRTRDNISAGVNIEEVDYAGDEERRSNGNLSDQSHAARHKPTDRRRLLVPADMTLAQLHDVLQAAMGWEDGHMHEFSVSQRRIGRPNPEDRLMGMPSVESERTVRLSGILGRVGSKAIYTYDFGDSWEHSLVLEKRLPVDPNTPYPVCSDGQLACPPEDCGGIPGFYDLVEALSDANHERHEEMLDWIGEFDPQAFSVESVNRMLTPLRRRRNTSRGRVPTR
ncbi:MAG TPA: plasmid pRiA4b ORF-3 family protein [Terriglobales bacterium]|jgi:hypothetical protein